VKSNISWEYVTNHKTANVLPNHPRSPKVSHSTLTVTIWMHSA